MVGTRFRSLLGFAVCTFVLAAWHLGIGKCTALDG